MRQLVFGLTVIIVVGLPLSGPAAQDQVEMVKEQVHVVNVEIPVRVFHHGDAVAGLRKSDFTLYEGKTRQKINGFYQKRKQIHIRDIDIQSQNEAKRAQPRYIVLVFRVSEYNHQIQRGLDILFDRMITPQDKLLVFINEKTLFMDQTYWGIKRKDIIQTTLIEESRRAHQRLLGYFLKIKQELDRTQLKLIEDDTYGRNPYFLMDFLKYYQDTWREYKKKYLLPDWDTYYHFSRHLEKINLEKWVINLYQIEMFPKMKITGRLRQRIEQMINELLVARSEDAAHSQIMSQMLDQIDRELNVANDFPVDQITKLLYKVDTTFHTILMGIEKETLQKDLEFRRISTDLENCLRQVTDMTGGELVATGNFGSALHTISRKEDIYYILTYRPSDPENIDRIRVEVKNKKYQVVYDDNFRADYITEYLEKKGKLNPVIQIENLDFNARRLSIALSEFLLQTGGESQAPAGKILVRVRIRDQQDQQIFDQTRTISCHETTVNINIDFGWLEGGPYLIIVDATDLLTGSTSVDILEAEPMTAG